MIRKRERRHWLDTVYDRLDRRKLAELVREAGVCLAGDELADMSRSELIQLLLDVAIEAEADAKEARADYPLRRPVRTPVPPWLAPPTGTVHLRWVDDWRDGASHLIDDGELTLPWQARSGDVVVTVLACEPPLVAAVERIERTGDDPLVDRVVIAQPVPWSSVRLSAGDAEPARRSARMSREAGGRLVDALRRELEHPGPVFVSAGDCTADHTYPSIVDALSLLQVDHPDRSGLNSWCASCGTFERLEFHFERPVHDNVELEIQDHLDDVVDLCDVCHELAHPHSVDAQRRALRPACPECWARDSRVVVFVQPAFGDWWEEGVVSAGRDDDSPVPAQWRCGSCEEDFVTITTARLRAVVDDALARGGDSELSSTAGASGRLRNRRRPRVRGQSLRPLEGEMRLASESGAALTLSAVLEPDPLEQGGLSLAYDVGLVSPDRDVRYLRRAVEPGFVDALARTLWGAAADIHPELSVATLSDQRAGFSFAIVGSDAATVTVEVTVIAELDAEVPDYDGLNFEVLRADLIAAAHRLSALHERLDGGECGGLLG